MTFQYKKALPHLLVLLGFVIVSLIYFSPVLSGKQVLQSDIVHYVGMAKQQKDFKAKTGQETYWTNSAFGGMPTYQLGAKYPNNYIKKLDLALRFLPRPADYLFLYFVSFYVLMLVLKVDFKLAALGALAFGFSTYLVIILGVGHNAKAHAIAYMPLVLSGIILTFRGRFLYGFLLTAVAMGLELVTNHFQMTYYLLLLVIVLGIAYLVDAYKKQELPHFFKAIGVLVGAVVLAIGLNATNIMATQEYAKESTRSASELTINADGSVKPKTSGLSYDYITEYSYGVLETFNLFIPRFMGGGNREDVGKNSKLYDFLIKQRVPPAQATDFVKNAPTYWGKQPIVEAPAYIGAVVVFLFVFALFLVKGRLKWWLVGGVVLSLLLSYGKNFGLLTNLFIDVVPLYNKFRAVSSIQVVLELCVPILAVFGLVHLFNTSKENEEGNTLKALKFTVYITAGLAVFFLVLKGTLFNFIGGNDAFFRQNYGQQFVNALQADRKTLFTKDAIRSLVLVLLSAGLIFGYLQKKIDQNKVILGLALLIVFDLVGVDRRYVNNDNFVQPTKVNQPYQANNADIEISKDTTHYRVLDVTSGGARTSYFHNALGGYHAAKMRRYNELYDFHVQKNNPEVINMLNTKYIITNTKEGQVLPYPNTEANGNAWFVTSVKKVNSANNEIKALDTLKTKIRAVTTDADLKNGTFTVDSLATIKLVKHSPNYLKYTSHNTNDGVAVFSEIFYKNGWNVYLDGNLVPHNRVNYVLRALFIPKGNHTITFKFEPKVIQRGSRIALASSVILILLLLGSMVLLFVKK